MSSTYQQQVQITPTDDPTRAAVENLIASIKSKQLQEAQRQSDRKILDIIHRVLGRTVDLAYDEDEQEKIQHELEQKQIIEDEKKIQMILEEEDMSVTLRVPDVSRMDIELEDKYDDEELDERQLEANEGKEKSIDISERFSIDEKIDMSRDPLYRYMLSEITDEDLLNIRGTHIRVPKSVIRKTQSLSAKLVKHDDKTVHRFCIQTAEENETLPEDVRAITQLYHQRARYRNKLPSSAVYYKHGRIPKYSIQETDEDDQDEVEQI